MNKNINKKELIQKEQQIIVIDKNKDPLTSQEEIMKKTGVKASFERGQLSQMRLFESFKSRNQFEKEESIEECDSFTNNIRAKKSQREGSQNEYQFDVQIKNQFKYPLQQSLAELESLGGNNISVIGSKSKKLPSSGMSSIVGDIDYPDKEDDGKQFSHLNDSKKLNKKDQIKEDVLSGGVDSKNIQNIGEKSPIAKNMLYSRRGSRRIPAGINASGVYAKESNAVNTQPHNNENKPNISQHKSGFFFALKMKKYANHLVSKLQSRRYANLRQRHLQFFNDKTIIPNEETGAFKNAAHGEDPEELEIESSINFRKKFVSMLKDIYKKYYSLKMKQFIEQLPMFQPSHKAKLFWDSLNMLSITYFLIFFPLRIAFGLSIEQSPASYVAMGIIFFDIIVNLNTGFYDKGTLVTERIGIFLHYIDTRLVTDILSIIPFIFYDVSDVKENIFTDYIKMLESVVSLLFLVRISLLGQIKKKIEERFYQNKTLTHVISLFTLLSITLYIAHLFSCIWIVVAQFRQDSQDTWMQYAKVVDDDWIVKYLYSLYFLIITMTTVGYGDIKPQNNLEHLFIIIIVLISSGVFSFSINKIGTIVQQMSEEKERVKETLEVINNYMNKKNINMNLQQQIREYLEYYLKESLINNNETEDKIIEMLSEPLKRSLMIEANKIALKDSPIFRNNFSDATISKTVSLIQELRCTPEEVIFYEGDIDSSAIFFVQQGKVELFIDSYKSTGEAQITSLKIFQKGSSFGETSFFTGGSRGISIRSIDFTTLLMIKRQDFLNVVKESSEDYEVYCKIRDKILFYKNFDDLGIKCISCNSRNHFLNDCPFIHYVSDKEKIIKIDQRPILAERCEFNQPRLQKFKVFENIEAIQISQVQFIEDQDIIDYLEMQDWYDGDAEDEEEYEFYNQYEGEDEEEEEGRRALEGGATDNQFKHFYKSYDTNNPHDQYQNQNSLTHPSAVKEDAYVSQHTAERMSYRKEDANFLLTNANQVNGETHSHKSGYKQQNILDVEEKRDKSASNLGLNELTLTPSGLVLNLMNPNPGNVRESSQKMQKRKRSASNSNLNNTPQILYKSHTLQNEDQGILQVQSSNFNVTNSAMLTTPQLNPLTNTPVTQFQPNSNINNPIRDALNNNYSIKQPSISRANSLVKRGTKRKNTEKTLRSTNKRKSTKKTIDSKMNIQVGTNSYQNDRKPLKKLTVIRKGFQENQIQNTLLALQGMENILLQNKTSTNSNEFDVMKTYEFYFPHNNIDIVIFQLRKKNPHLYAKSKSFVKSTTKKLYGAMTMNSQHNRMSKMDIVLSKFLMMEADEERDKDSLHSNRLKSFTHNTHKTPKTQYANNNDFSHSRHKNQEKKRSFNISNNDVLDQLQDSPIALRSKCKSMKISNYNRDANSHFQLQNANDESSHNQQSLHHHDDIYLDGFENKQTLNLIQAVQNSLLSNKTSSNNNILPVEEQSPKKNVSFQDN